MLSERAFTLPLLDWVNVPAGRVSVLADASDGSSSLIPFEVAPFTISKHQITQAQFQAFIDDGGYREKRWWAFSSAARQCFEAGAQPSECVLQGESLPRTHVSWYEAMAFCSWLGYKLGVSIALPTEAQWQWAAQGNDGYGMDMWIRQWLTPSRGELPKDIFGKVVPVDWCADGPSPFGVMNMSSTVWEWCLNKYDAPGDASYAGGIHCARVIRGGEGSFYSWGVRGTGREKGFPRTQARSVSFRLAGPALLYGATLLE